MKHIVLIILITVVVSMGIFLPFIPGDYDYLAAVLSTIFQFAAFTSLLLVPVGLTWSSIEIVKSKGINDATKHRLRQFAIAATKIIILASALGAFASNSRYASIIVLILGVYIVSKMRRKGNEPGHMNSGKYSFTPYYFIFIPLILLFIRLTFLEKVKNNTINYVIKQSEQLIQDIEAYKVTNGHYPVSLVIMKASNTREGLPCCGKDFHASLEGVLL